MKPQLLFVYAVLALCQFTARASTLTMTVNNVANDGVITIQWVVNGGPIQSKDISVNAGDSSGLASAIASAIGSSATATGSKVSINAGSNSGYATIAANKLVKYTSNSDGYSYLPGTPAGIFAFQPDPVTGNSTLLTSSTITAGFTAGLPDVSFDAAAGQTTAQLTSTLQAALFSAGYKTILMAPAELEIFADGSSSSVPTEFDLTLSPDTLNVNPGISTSSATPAPESGTLTMLGLALTVFGLVRRRSRLVQAKAALI
jgi:hypothetical protein